MNTLADEIWKLRGKGIEDYTLCQLSLCAKRKQKKIDSLTEEIASLKQQLSDSISKQEIREWVEENGELSVQKAAIPLGDDVTSVTFVLKALLEKLDESNTPEKQDD